VAAAASPAAAASREESDTTAAAGNVVPITPPPSAPSFTKPTASMVSQWWQCCVLFDPKKHPDKLGFARCKHCRVEVSIKSGRSGLASHIKSKHEDILRELEKDHLKRVPVSTLLGATKKKSKLLRREDMLAATVAWVVEENQPFNATEKGSFRRMMSVFDDEKHGPTFTARDIRGEIMKLGIVCQEAVKRELKGKYFSCTTDHWTSPNNETCSCLTAHWIEGGEMKRCALTFEVFHGTAAGVELGKDFIKNFDACGFDLSFVIAVVTDTAGNVNTFGECLRGKGAVHLCCVDHNLHRCALLAFKDDNLPNSENAMEAARSMVGFFTMSTQAMGKLLAMQTTMSDGLKQAVKLFQDVVTRWWSTWRMLTRLRELGPPISAVIGAGLVNKADLTPHQKAVLKEVEEILKPMASAQRHLEGDKHPTISLVPYHLYKIRKTLSDFVADDARTYSARHLAKVLLKDFNQNRYGDGTAVFHDQVVIGRGNRCLSLHPDVILATALDPRMKSLAPFIPVGEHQRVWDKLLQEMIALARVADGDDSDDEEEEQNDNHGQRQNQMAEMDEDYEDMYDDIAMLDNAPAVGNEIELMCLSELTVCKSTAVLKMEKDADPLLWWLERKDKYPTLFKLSVRHLCITATSAPSERLWSLASRIITIRRARLKGEIVADIIFLKENSAILQRHHFAITGLHRVLPNVYEQELNEILDEADDDGNGALIA
jgi:hypothetical protein